MRQQFARELRSLDKLFQFLEKFTEAECLDVSSSYAVALAVEEFFVNIVKYSRGPGTDVLVEAIRSGNTVTIRMEEESAVPFDVTRPTQTQFDLPAMDRRPGGLGIHIAKEMLDGVAYEHAEGTSRITLTKHLEK